MRLIFCLPFIYPALAYPTGTSTDAGNSNCFDLIVPVQANVTTYPLQFPPFKSGYEATEFLLQIIKRDASSDSSLLFGAPVNSTKTYDISARYCSAAFEIKGGAGQTVQILTHGLGFDKSYWHFGSAEYNYAQAANKAGYATLSYDRLGNGLSSIVDPYNEQQAQVELAILLELTKSLKAGTISSKIPVPAKVVHVGHSFGSLLSNGIAATAPEMTDGIVMTGYSHNTTWIPWFSISTAFILASEDQPDRFGNLSSGFLTWATKYNNQFSFLKYPYFDPAVLDTAEATKFPFSVGEFFSQPMVPVSALTFAKPAMLMAADSDLIFCGADCHGIVDGPTSNTPQVFPAASPLEIYIQPNSGHGMNLHHNATGWYDVVFDFLDKNGL